MIGYMAALRADLRNTLLTVPGLPAAIAWEGREFTPPAATRWAREMLYPLGTEQASLGPSGSVRDTLVYEIEIHDPPTSAGLSELETLVDTIMYAYPPGVTVGGATVFGRVTETSRTPIKEGPQWRRVAARVRFFVHRSTRVSA